MVAVTAECEICRRQEGAEVDRCGEADGVPLGPIEPCETCGRLACPDCRHEADCCFAGAEEHRDEPDWAPTGWVRSDRPSEYVRVEGGQS